jgi:hypothetical protein
MSLPYTSIISGGLALEGNGSIKPTSILDCADLCGTAGQILSSTGTTLEWITPSTVSNATPAARGIVFGCTTDAHPVSGSGDVALGLNAYAAVTTGYSNAAIGGDALARLTSGCNNIGIGDQAGFAITGESDNVIIGANSVLNCAPSRTVVVGSGVDFVFDNTENVIVGHSAASNGALGTAISCSVILGGCALTSANQVGDNLIAIGHAIALPNPNGSTQLAIGNGTSYWLSGDSNYAVKPGGGIIDCAGSCGTSGQILQSTGSNAIQWASPGATYSGYNGYKSAVTSGTAFNVTGWPREQGRNWMGQLNIFTTYGTDPASEYFPAANALIMVNGFNGVGSTTVQAFNSSSGVFTVEANSYPAYTDTTIVFTPSVTTDRMNFYIRYLDSSGNGGPGNSPEPFSFYLTIF